jgi:hypothetical protein
MRRFLVFCGLFVMIVSLNFPAYAWELTLKGEAEWRYRYWTRLGNNDIFGVMGVNDVNLGINHLQTFPTAATTNRGAGTFGVLAGENRFGPDMQLTDYRVTIFPKIAVNKAIDITASLNFTSLGIWSDGQPLVGSGLVAAATNPGFVNSLYLPIQDRAVNTDVPNTYVTVQWLKASVRTPMFDFSYGFKNSKIGIGLWKHEGNRASSSFGITAHYGPFKIGFSPYFGRNQSAWSLGTSRSRIEGTGAAERMSDRRNYFHAVMGELEYLNGPLFFQIVSDSYYLPQNQQPDARGVAISANRAGDRPIEDELRYRIATAMKYFNGRFFVNAEVDWYNRWRTGRGLTNSGVQNVGPNPLFTVRQDRNNGGWVYGVETGCLCGPTKFTANYVRATGNDPGTRITTEDAADTESGVNAFYMKEWGYLMYYMYGAGDGWDAAGYGQPTNLHHAGVKLNYAIASNLNVSTILSKAWRDHPDAYRLGGDYRLGIQQWTNDDIFLTQQGAFRGQAVPDSARDIGWELDLIVNWKLLENFNWNTTLAYWQPGNWWAYAYPDTASIYRRGVAPLANSQTTPGGQNNAIAGIGRSIDPLFAVETNLLIPF